MKKYIAALCAVAVILSVILSCGDDASLNRVFNVSASAPVFLSYKVVSGRQIDFHFSTPVDVVEAVLDPDAEIEGITGGETVSVMFADEHSTGEQLIVDMLVEDGNGNTLSLLFPFRTRNDRIPKMLINEVRTETGTSTAGKKGEFVELKTLTAGNLGAARLFIARAGIDVPVYEFPPVEAAAGEYIVLHVRTYPEENGVDELGGPETFGLTHSTANAHPAARDLWTNVNAEQLRMTDALYLLDQEDKVLDAVMFYKTAEEWEKNKVLSQTAEMLAKQGEWLARNGELVKTPTENDAAANTRATATRTLCRDETVPDSNTAADWYVTDTSNASPGLPNSIRRFPGS
jgi:hypothetical protein